MKLYELRKQFIYHMKQWDTPQDVINMLANDVHTLMYIEHLHHKEKITIAQMFMEFDFQEFLHNQPWQRKTFEQLIGE